MTFKDDMTADLRNTAFNEQEFAEPAVYRSKLGVATPISVIFDSKYAEVGFDESVVQTREILAWTPEVGLPVSYDKDPGAKLLVRNTTFNIITAKPDGAGVVDLVLHRT